MKYALVIYEDDDSWRWHHTNTAAHHDAYQTWIAEVTAAGKLVCGESFDTGPVGTDAVGPATVRKPPGGTMTVAEGPAHNREVTLAGWFVLDVADREEAVALAKRLGTPETIEVRPVLGCV